MDETSGWKAAAGYGTVRKEDDEKIAQEIYNACLETEDIRKIKELQKKWRDMQNGILDELAMRIKYISMKYEG